MTCSTDGVRLSELDSKKIARAWKRIHVEVTYYRLLVVPNQHAGFESGILSERTRRQLTTPVLEDVRGTPLTIDVLLKYVCTGCRQARQVGIPRGQLIAGFASMMASSLLGRLSMTQRVSAFAMQNGRVEKFNK
jgi:hypothetical protein